MEVRRVLGEDAQLLRHVRLRALQDAAYAFSSSFERERGLPAAFWSQRARESQLAERGVVFVGVDGVDCVGMAGGFFDGEQTEVATLWGMWVDPRARRRGLGRDLVAAVSDWARERGAARVDLCVSGDPRSQPAANLYGALGFAPTGERGCLASDPSLETTTMSLEL
jgi:GNAT superfamily N-acetyltransferase